MLKLGKNSYNGTFLQQAVLSYSYYIFVPDYTVLHPRAECYIECTEWKKTTDLEGRPACPTIDVSLPFTEKF